MPLEQPRSLLEPVAGGWRPTLRVTALNEGHSHDEERRHGQRREMHP